MVCITNYFIFANIFVSCNNMIIMELQDKPLNPQESLQLIQKFISGARFSMRKFAFGIIFFGILTPLAALLHYFFIRFTNFSMPWLPWPVLMISGFIITMIYYARLGRKKETVTSTSIFFQWFFTWGGITYFLLAFLCVQQHINPTPFMLALTSLLIGVSGLALRYKPMLWGGILFFIAAIVCVFINPLNQLLMMAITIIIGYLIPGIMLTRKKAE